MPCPVQRRRVIRLTRRPTYPSKTYATSPFLIDTSTFEAKVSTNVRSHDNWDPDAIPRVSVCGLSVGNSRYEIDVYSPCLSHWRNAYDPDRASVSLRIQYDQLNDGRNRIGEHQSLIRLGRTRCYRACCPMCNDRPDSIDEKSLHRER